MPDSFFTRLVHGVRRRNKVFKRILTWYWRDVLRGHGEKELPTETVLRLSSQYFYLLLIVGLVLVKWYLGIAVLFLLFFTPWLLGPDLVSTRKKRGAPHHIKPKKTLPEMDVDRRPAEPAEVT